VIWQGFKKSLPSRKIEMDNEKKDLSVTPEELATFINEAVEKSNAPLIEEMKRKAISAEVPKEVKDLVGIEKAARWLQAFAARDFGTVKALSEGMGADGGYLVPAEFRAIVTEKLLKAAAIRPYAQILPMGRDKLEIPVEGAAVTAYWKAESAPLVESNPDWGQVILNTNKLTGLSKMSRELFADSAINIVNYVAGRFAKAFAASEDTAFVGGSGTGEPKGFRQYSITGIPQAGANLTGDDLIALYYALPVQYRKNAIWLMHNSVIQLCRTLKDGTLGRYLWTDGFGEAPATIFGRPVVECDDIPINLGTGADESEIWLADMSYYAIGDRQSMEVEQTTEGGDAFINHELWLKVIERLDGQMLLAEAFNLLTGVK